MSVPKRNGRNDANVKQIQICSIDINSLDFPFRFFHFDQFINERLDTCLNLDEMAWAGGPTQLIDQLFTFDAHYLHGINKKSFSEQINSKSGSTFGFVSIQTDNQCKQNLPKYFVTFAFSSFIAMPFEYVESDSVALESKIYFLIRVAMQPMRCLYSCSLLPLNTRAENNKGTKHSHTHASSQAKYSFDPCFVLVMEINYALETKNHLHFEHETHRSSISLNQFPFQRSIFTTKLSIFSNNWKTSMYKFFYVSSFQRITLFPL